MSKMPLAPLGYIAATLLLGALMGGCGRAEAVTAPSKAVASPPAVHVSLPPEKRDPNRLWCNEHDVYEDECVLCHPELANKEAAPEAHDEHEAPEAPEAHEAHEEGHVGGELMCKEHHVVEAECGVCHPERIAALAVGESMKIRFVSGESADKAGITVEKPLEGTDGDVQELLGEVSFNQNRLAFVAPLGGGVVKAALKDVGDRVAEGDVLATVQSADLAAARSEYQKAMAQAGLAQRGLKRERDLFQRQISARQDLEAAEAEAAVAQSALAESRQHLLSMGLRDYEVSGEKSAQAESAVLPVRAPFTGTIIERKAVPGLGVQPGDALYRIADLDSMWMTLSVPERLLASVATGTKVTARFEAYPGLAFEGEIRWVSPSVDPATRMLQARAELPNPRGLLKDGFFGRATLGGSSGQTGLSLPIEAVQDVDGQKLVFLKRESDLYEARRVALGASIDGRVTITAGLDREDAVVSKGSHIVKSELLKARLGAGCADE